MEKGKTSKRYSAEVRSRAVRMVLEHGGDHASQWAAIGSIAAKIGCTTETLRGWVRHRAKLVGLRSNLKCQVHAVLAGAGVQVLMSDLFGPAGQQLLTTARLALESRSRVDSLLRMITALDFEIDTFGRLLGGRLRTDPGYTAIQAIPGVGPLLAAVFVAEIGDITRFSRPQQLASWAGLTPKHHESDTTIHRGRITKQGSRLVRWAAVEAVQRVSGHTRLGQIRDRTKDQLHQPSLTGPAPSGMTGWGWSKCGARYCVKLA